MYKLIKMNFYKYNLIGGGEKKSSSSKKTKVKEDKIDKVSEQPDKYISSDSDKVLESDSISTTTTVSAYKLPKKITKPTIYSKAPYQRKISFMRFPLQQNLDKTRAHIYQDDGDDSAWPHAYRNETDFLQDLYVIRDSLYSHGDQKIADLVLKDFTRLVESFGFYLMHLDIRQQRNALLLVQAQVINISVYLLHDFSYCIRVAG